MRALVVDDSKTIRLLITSILEELGFEVQEAENGLAALELIRSEPQFDIALVDWEMPEMDGLALLHALRDDGSFDQLRLIIVTTKSEMSDVVEALEAGADEYLMKPFTKEILAEKLRWLRIHGN